MHSIHRTFAAALAAVVSLAAADIAAAQQYIGPRRQAGQAPPPRTAPAANQPAGARQPADPSQYPVRRTAANDGGAPPAGAAQGARQIVQPVAPQAPFTLTPQQQTLLDSILVNWEKQSDSVGTFTCTFGRWDVNETFGPPENQFQLSKAFGKIKFKAPDHGVYVVDSQDDWDKQKRAYVPRSDGLDHWVCNGKSIFEYNTEKKELVERELAPQMQGKAITEGPLPFVFGTKADQLKRRYWMRDITPSDAVNQQIWLEAWPKFQRDAANFQHAIIILRQRDYMPTALRIILPDGKNKQDYAFENIQIDNPLSILKGDFLPPMKPFGWTKVFIPAQAPGPPAAPAQAPAQARQPAAPAAR